METIFKALIISYQGFDRETFCRNVKMQKKNKIMHTFLKLHSSESYFIYHFEVKL